jgi:integrase
MAKKRTSMGWSLHKRGKVWSVYHRFTPDGLLAGKSTGCHNKEDAYRVALEIVREARVNTQLTGLRGGAVREWVKKQATDRAEETLRNEEELLLGDQLDKTNPRLVTLWNFGESYRTDTGWIPDHLRSLQKSPTYITTFRSRWRSFIQFLPPEIQRVNQVTRQHCIAFVEKRVHEVKASTLYTSVTPSVRKVFHILIEKGWYHAPNPMEIYKQTTDRLPVERVKVLSDEAIVDIESIVQDFGDPAFHIFFRLGIEAGMRRGEMANLLWENVHLDGKPEPYLVVRPNSEDPYRGVCKYTLKTRGSRRTIPLRKPLVEFLRPHQQASGYVIDSTKYKCNRYFFRIPESLLAAIKAKYPFFTYHVMRHTFVSQALMVGKVPPIEVSKWVGDNLKTVLNTYSHFMPTGNINNW